ncbi:MAG: zinc resistance protein [Desulfovibrio sp.]
MKKNIIAFTLVLFVGLAFVTTNAMAWNYGNCGGWSGNTTKSQNFEANQKAYQEFLKSTEKLRADINADQAELAAIMAGSEPDPKKARALTEQINTKLSTLNEKAIAQNIPLHGMRGSGMGRGMGRGMGHGMGHGMMGSNNYNCARW